MATVLLTALVVISASLHLRAEYLGPLSDVYIFKPLTMILILGLATRVTNGAWTRYRRWIVGGLVVSLVGDVLLMLPQDLFVPGLVAFLVAHLMYIAAFRVDRIWGRIDLWSLVPFALYGLFMFILLEPVLDSMLVPVAV
ncbi:MAG: lysoplasmalogenase, partial [Anaerolineales bacterium]|nr:lysoplasmalogenase [Anaerolineales bacterium]